MRKEDLLPGMEDDPYARAFMRGYNGDDSDDEDPDEGGTDDDGPTDDDLDCAEEDDALDDDDDLDDDEDDEDFEDDDLDDDDDPDDDFDDEKLLPGCCVHKCSPCGVGRGCCNCHVINRPDEGGEA